MSSTNWNPWKVAEVFTVEASEGSGAVVVNPAVHQAANRKERPSPLPVRRARNRRSRDRKPAASPAAIGIPAGADRRQPGLLVPLL